jgi:hypothetical protein
MDVRKELETLRFRHGGEICREHAGGGCRLELNSELPSYAVWILVADDEIKMVGATGRRDATLKKRMQGAVSTINAVLVRRQHLDATEPFKRLAPKVIAANGKTHVWARESTAHAFTGEQDALNHKYNPKWWGRRRG